MNRNYNEDSIQTLSILEAIRVRPAMYIGVTDDRGILHLYNEIISNSIDEYHANRCSKIFVEFYSEDNKVVVEDDGAGIPIGKLEEILTKSHSGGKFNNNETNSAYMYSTGLHGVGTTATNALSSYFRADVWRDNKESTIIFKNGGKKVMHETSDIRQPRSSGTRIEFIPDVKIFGDSEMNIEELIKMTDFKANINSGIEIQLSIDNSKPMIFRYDDGVLGFFRRDMKTNKISTVMKNPIYIKGNDGAVQTVEAVVNFSASTEVEHLLGFINGVETKNVDSEQKVGIRNGVSDAIIYLLTKHDLMPKRGSKVTRNDIRSVLVGLVLGRHINPQFESQTKEKFNSKGYLEFARKCAYNAVIGWAESNYNDFSKVGNFLVRIVKANDAARSAKNTVMKSASSKKSLIKNIDMKKFTDCKSTNPVECELFLTEGASAGSSAAEARDSRTQALYRSRGKIINVIKQNRLSEELNTVVEIMGCGIGAKKDMKKLRYHKIIVLCDADIDGEHIATLWMGFFFKFYPEMIERGMIYIAKPPLYVIKSKKEKIYIQNQERYKIVSKKVVDELFDFVNLKNNKVLSNELKMVYLNKIEGYNRFIDNINSQLNISPWLLETLIVNMNDILRGKFNELEKLGFENISIVWKPKEKRYLLDVNYGLTHNSISIDKNFWKHIYVPIYNRLVYIKINKVGFRYKKTKELFGITTYDNARLLDNILRGNNKIVVTRAKGLGELNPDELAESAMDPATRNIVKVDMSSRENALKWFNILLGDSNIDIKKNLILRKD